MMEEQQNRYIIDVRRVHQEISNGPTTNCKYCGLYDSKYHCGFVADLLLPEIYLDISNKAFFRSGKYFWKQNSYLSCCKEYAIRMNVSQFHASHKQKQVYNKFAKQMNQKLNILNDHKVGNDNQQIEEEKVDKSKQKSQQLQEKLTQVDTLQQQAEKEVKQLVSDLFNSGNGFKNENYTFKIFKTKGKKEESDYYSNIIQIIFNQNKVELGTIEQFLEKYGEQMLIFLNKAGQQFAYTIHPQLKFLLLKNKDLVQSINQVKKQSKQQVTNQNNQDTLKIKQQPNKSTSNTIEKVKQDKPKQSKEDRSKQTKEDKQKQKKENKKLDSYINEDGSIRFDEFNSKFIRIGNLEITLESNEYDEQVYQIHCDYFKDVHQRDPQSSDKFAADKCTQIIEQQVLVSKVDPSQKLYTGTFFFKYRLNGELIAVSHVDILPQMFMSQYFFYKPELKKSYKLGIVSALIEIEYVRRLQKLFPQFLYFNFVQFIAKTTKMNYKADFQKQEILCPETYRWVDLTLELKKHLFENPTENPRLAPPDWKVIPDHNFIDFDIENFLYSEFMMYINGKYLMIDDLIPESQPQLMVNLACMFQAMGKSLFNSLTFGY